MDLVSLCVVSLIAAALALSAGCATSEGLPGSERRGTGPLASERVMAFAVTSDAQTCRAFYEGTLGLRFVEEDAFAVVLDAGGTIIRIQKMKEHQPAGYTVLGWNVPDIRATAARLGEAGVKLERYAWMTMQDEAGIATFANGDRVAWFKDPEGNILSIAQLARRGG